MRCLEKVIQEIIGEIIVEDIEHLKEQETQSSNTIFVV
jgi:hypothetical protein